MFWLVLIWLVFCQLDSFHRNRHKLCIIFFSKTRKIQSRTIIFREPYNNLLTNITGSSHTEEYCPLVVFLWTLLHSVCTTSEGQPFPDFFQAGILWTLRYSFFFSLCYHVKRGLQIAVTVTVKASHTLSSAERDLLNSCDDKYWECFTISLFSSYVSIAIHTVQLPHLPLYIFLNGFFFFSF